MTLPRQSPLPTTRADGRTAAGLVATRRRGATVIEFSLVFIIFIILTLGLFEFGRLIWTFHTLTHAAREGLRVAMIQGTVNAANQDDAISAVENAVEQHAVGLDPEQITVTPSWPSGISRGENVEITASYNFEFVTGGLFRTSGGLALETTAGGIVLN